MPRSIEPPPPQIEETRAQAEGMLVALTHPLSSQIEMPSMSPLRFSRAAGILTSVLVGGLTVILAAQQPLRRVGGAYSELDQRRQQLVNDWVQRFVGVTGQSVAAPAFYDDVLSLSAKTTFEAV